MNAFRQGVAPVKRVCRAPSLLWPMCGDARSSAPGSSASARSGSEPLLSTARMRDALSSTAAASSSFFSSSESSPCSFSAAIIACREGRGSGVSVRVQRAEAAGISNHWHRRREGQRACSRSQ